MVTGIAFVGYPTTDMERTKKFYEGLLGLKPDAGFEDSDQFIEYTIGDTTISIGKMDGWKPSKDGPCVALEVDNMDETISMLKQNNIDFVMETEEFPPCFMAIVRDPDGNQVVIHKRK